MTQSREENLKVGELLYRYISCFPAYVFRYEVVCVHEYQDVVQYHLKCLSCQDHTPCELLVAKDDYGRFKYVQCLNNRGGNYGEDDQRHWHVEGENFYTSREEALIEKLKKTLKEKDVEIEQAKERLDACKQNRECIAAELANLNEILEVKNDTE